MIKEFIHLWFKCGCVEVDTISVVITAASVLIRTSIAVSIRHIFAHKPCPSYEKNV